MDHDQENRLIGRSSFQRVRVKGNGKRKVTDDRETESKLRKAF
jgi:hypothetical protein